MFLFDLQTVAFLVLKSARCIAEIATSPKGSLPRSVRLSLSPIGLKRRLKTDDYRWKAWMEKKAGSPVKKNGPAQIACSRIFDLAF